MSVLYIFVEGLDDEIFIRSFFWQLIERYNKVKIFRYAQRKDDQVKGLIRATNKRNDWDYIFFTDYDAYNRELNYNPAKKKKEIQKRYDGILDNDKIIIVKEEIESWYCASINYSRFKLPELNRIKDTESVTKEKFEHIVKKRYRRVTDFMIECMKSFNLQQGIERNQSLNKAYNYLINGEKI